MTADEYPVSALNQTEQLRDAFTASTFEFPQTSTDVLYSPQPLSAGQDLNPLHEQPPLSSQPNSTFCDFH